jgi:diguanylate cyclase (GGDEF)-like protein
MALRDPLTGLLNRRAFDEELRWIWIQGREESLPIGLLILDIDHFKVMNDTYGHVVGDQVLRESARLVQACVRDHDVVCRYYGGDELVVILPGSNEADTRQVAERMLEAFRNATLCKATYEIQTTISIGVNCTRPGLGHDAETFLIQADRALYRAKQTGRNKACFADELAPPSPSIVAQAAPAGMMNTNHTVLLVDDDQALCLLFQRMLTRHNFDVRIAATGSAALEIASRERGLIDVALVDLHLGAENGLDVLKSLRTIDDGIVGVVITGQATLDDAVASIRHGAFDFVRKPVAQEQLVAVLEKACDYRRLVAENKRYRDHLENMVREKNAALSRVIDQITDSYQFTLEAMADMLDAREQMTGAHSKRVSRMSVLLARKMGCSLEEIEIIGTGALLHDIGKIGIPDAILLKAGPLNPEEREIMKMHPQIGYNIIKAGPGLEPASEIVLEHQERFDGGGYPRGLKGAEITLGARIFSVADAYDAIRSDRFYSQGRSAQVAREEIAQHRGTQFDPSVADLLLRCQDEIEEIGGWPAR